MGVESLLERVAALDTPTVSDALDALGIPGVITGIAPVWNCERIAGRVQTMQLGPVPDEAPATTHHLGARSIDNASEGDVIVVDNRAGDGISAGWGGLLALAASLRNLSGIVVYGACRDIDDIESVALPVYAHSVTPRTARSRTIEISANEVLQFEDVTVAPGDLVIADRSGVAFIPIARAQDVIRKAEEIQQKEQEMADRLRQGASVRSVLAGNYESMLDHPSGEGGMQ
jgi:4-hydroxy-4-methyl-2-oxoglutarate aldolase